MTAARNRYLTAANEGRVLRLIQDGEAKTRWQVVAASRGKAAADTCIANLRCQPMTTIKAARFYW